MVSFQIKILIVTIIILIFSLIIIGRTIHNNKTDKWPPISTSCPDYWELDETTSPAMCVNTKKIGTCNALPNEDVFKMSFNEKPFNGLNGRCAKYKWAKNCDVSWDGITYGVQNPCQ